MLHSPQNKYVQFSGEENGFAKHRPQDFLREAEEEKDEAEGFMHRMRLGSHTSPRSHLALKV